MLLLLLNLVIVGSLLILLIQLPIDGFAVVSNILLLLLLSKALILIHTVVSLNVRLSSWLTLNDLALVNILLDSVGVRLDGLCLLIYFVLKKIKHSSELDMITNSAPCHLC